jgi:hypothetical protein
VTHQHPRRRGPFRTRTYRHPDFRRWICDSKLEEAIWTFLLPREILPKRIWRNYTRRQRLRWLYGRMRYLARHPFPRLAWAGSLRPRFFMPGVHFMPSNYPGGFDSLSTSYVNATPQSTTHPTHHDDLADAVNKIEAELGLLPKGGYASVRARLDALASGGAAGHTEYVYNVITDYGAAGDGVADDTTALNNAITAAKAVNGLIYSPAGKTYKTSSTLTINQACSLDFSGSMIKKAAAMTTDAVSLTGSGINLKKVVVDGSRPVGEVQTITITGSPTGGTFTLTFNAQTTAAINWNDPASTVQTRLEALSSITAGKVVVSGGPGPATPYRVTFYNTMAGADQPLITLATNSLTGGASPSVTIVETLKGSAGATGGGIVNTGGTSTNPNILDHVVMQNNFTHGFHQDAGGTPFLAALSCDSFSNTTYNNPGGIAGFKVDNGTLTVSDCDANNNEWYGFRFVSTASDNCIISNCRSFQTGLSPDTFTIYAQGNGLWIGNNRGICDSFRSLDDRTLGIIIQSSSTTPGAQAAEWLFGTLEGSLTGYTAKVPEGSGVNLSGAFKCKIGTVIANANNGYGLLLGRNATNPSVGTTYCAIGNVLCDGSGSSFDSDPGCSISGGSNYNYIGNLQIKSYTSALMIGEDAWPQPVPSNPIGLVNAHNYIASVRADKCTYAGVLINFGQYNRVDSFVSRNTYNTDTALAGGLVSFYPDRATSGNGGAKDTSWVVNNIVDRVDHKTDSFAISTASNASPIVITTTQVHTFDTGDQCVVAGVATNTNANGTWTVTRLSTTTFSLNGTTGNGAGTGGTATYRKPTHILHTSTNASKNKVGRVDHRGDFATAFSNFVGDASNVAPYDSPTVARRVTADRTTTLATASNVTDMAFYADVNEQWAFEFNLLAGCNGAGGTKYAITFPTGATLAATAIGPSGANTTITSERMTVSGTLTTAVFVVSNASGYVRIVGMIVNGATAGSVQLQFASGTATQTSTVSANSTLTAQQSY